MNLRGKTILVTRPHDQAHDLVAALNERGAVAVVIPMIRIVPPERWEAFDEAAHNIGRYDGIVFTSANAVKMVAERLRELNLNVQAWKDKRIYAVGERTREQLAQMGLTVEHVPDSYSADALAGHLRLADVKGKRFLLPQGNLSRDVLATGLRGLGALVDGVEVYRNIPPDESVLESLRHRVEESEFDVVTFASPSAAENFARAVSPTLLQRSKARVAVIGPTTREAVRRLGFPVDIEASTFTAAGLAEAIEKYFSNEEHE